MDSASWFPMALTQFSYTHLLEALEDEVGRSGRSSLFNRIQQIYECLCGLEQLEADLALEFLKSDALRASSAQISELWLRHAEDLVFFICKETCLS